MESHRINRKDVPYPEIGEIVLVFGEEKNRGEWKKSNVVEHIHGRDEVIRAVKLQRNNRLIGRPNDRGYSFERNCLLRRWKSETLK